MDWQKWIDGMKDYTNIACSAAGAAFGLWAFLLIANAVLVNFNVGITPVFWGVAVGTEFWPTLGLFVAIGVLVGVIRQAWTCCCKE